MRSNDNQALNVRNSNGNILGASDSQNKNNNSASRA
jgi:hypothetical protein